MLIKSLGRCNVLDSPLDFEPSTSIPVFAQSEKVALCVLGIKRKHILGIGQQLGLSNESRLEGGRGEVRLLKIRPCSGLY
jgi:hypothetical protein